MKDEAVRRILKLNHPHLFFIGRRRIVYPIRVTKKGFNLYSPDYHRVLLPDHFYDVRYGNKSIPENSTSVITYLGCQTNDSLVEIAHNDVYWPNTFINWSSDGYFCLEITSLAKYNMMFPGLPFYCDSYKRTKQYEIGIIHSRGMANNKNYVFVQLHSGFNNAKVEKKEITIKNKGNGIMSFNKLVSSKQTVKRDKLVWLNYEELSHLQLSKFNRIVSPKSSRVKKVQDSIEKHGFDKDYPILVDTNGVIQRGAHRWSACRNIKSGAYVQISNEKFILGRFNVEIEKENSSSRWLTPDMVASFANAGTGDYPLLQKFMDDTGLPIKASVALLKGQSALLGGREYDAVKLGYFKATHYKEAMEFVRYLQNFKDALPRKNDWKKAGFVMALAKVISSPKVDKKKLLQAVKRNRMRANVQQVTAENIRQLCEFYNYKLTKKYRINPEDFMR